MEKKTKKKSTYRDFTKISGRANILLNIIMIFFSLCCILPLLLVFTVSITDEKTVSHEGFSLFPSKLSLSAYTYVMKDMDVILRAYGVSIFVTVVGSLLSIIVISLFAYVISRKYFKYRRFFTMVVLFPMLLNAGLVPWYMVYTKYLNLTDKLFGLILPLLVTPLYVLIMRTFFLTSVPDEVVEAAKIDGAGELRIYTQIVLPLAKPALATIGLFNVLAYWNDWYYPMLLINNPKLYNLQYLMYKVEQSIMFLTSNAGVITDTSRMLANIPSQTARMAMAMIAIGPIIFAYPFFQKYFVEGLTIGSVKG
ncbi:MAG: carbohydrate ABC transporter permease [Bacillota bacterium]